MKFYTYQKESLSYKKFNFFKPKILFWAIFVQLFLSISILFFISSFYNTPKERKLKKDISYLVNEFDAINKRIIESESILETVEENDSIIYQSIFDVSEDYKKEFELYYESEISNDYSDLINETNRRLSILDKKLAKELYSLNSLVDEAYSHQDMLIHIPAIQPIDNKDLKRTASGWGYRIHPIYKIRKFHFGLDFTAPINTPIYATGDAQVQFVIESTDRSSKGYGNLIILNHDYGYRTLYAHLNKFNVKQGQYVKRGEIIGYVGSTGISTGPHLHYEVIKNGVKVNPVNYLFNSLTPEEYHKIINISNSPNKSYD